MKQLISFVAIVFAFACLGVFAGSVFGTPRMPMPTMVVHAQTPPSHANWCGIHIAGQTANRYVYGYVNAECGGCGGHTAPFGNWGVDSFFSNATDGQQYKGWATYNWNCGESMDDPEWNSCTPDFSFHPYLNHPPVSPTQQFSGDTTTLGAAWDWYSTTEENGCSVLHESSFSGFSVLSIWELDPWSVDEHITNLTAYSGYTQLSCNVDGCAQTSTPFQNTGDAVTSADFRVSLWSSCHYIPGKGC